jgi:hypothetical protein
VTTGSCHSASIARRLRDPVSRRVA